MNFKAFAAAALLTVAGGAAHAGCNLRGDLEDHGYSQNRQIHYEVSTTGGQSWKQCDYLPLLAMTFEQQQPHYIFYGGLRQSNEGSIAWGVDCGGVKFRKRFGASRPEIMSNQGEWYYMNHGEWAPGYIVAPNTCESGSNGGQEWVRTVNYSDESVWEVAGHGFQLRRVDTRNYSRRSAQGTFTF